MLLKSLYFEFRENGDPFSRLFCLKRGKIKVIANGDDLMKTLFYGGKIITMADPLYAECVIVENGVITAVGSEEELLQKYCPQERLDLHGAVMIPAFIDPHSHFTQTAYALLQADLNGVTSLNEINQKINGYIFRNNVKPGEWIIARGYDHNLFSQKKNPPLDALDKMFPGHPLVIQHKSGHMGIFNSLALKELGVDEHTGAPQGGTIEQENGKLTGYMEENAFFEYLKKVPQPPAEKLMEAFEAAQKKYASYGITTVQDGMAVKEMLPLYQSLADSESLNIELVAYCDILAFEAAEKTLAGNILKYENNFKIGGIKIFLDGSPQGKTAWMKTPYKGGDDHGCSTMTNDEVCRAFETAAQKGVQIIAHCNGDAACEQFLTCLEKTAEKFPRLRELRPVMIHAQFITEEQIKRAKNLGVILSFFAAHIYHWGDVHAENFGFERASKISPAKWAEKYGAIYTFHQDTPVIEPDMAETLWCAVNRKTKSGRLLGEEQKIPPLHALKAVTVNAAYQYFEEDTKGSIEPGKAADLTVLSSDPLSCKPDEIRNIRILKTYKNGNLIFDLNH